MIFRRRLLSRTLAQIYDGAPQNLSLVGPRFSGKSRLMRALYDELHSVSNGNVIPIYWDVSSDVEELSNEEAFFRIFFQRLNNHLAVEDRPKEASDWLDPNSDRGRDSSKLRRMLFELMEELDELKQKRVVILMDGIDSFFGRGFVTEYQLSFLRKITDITHQVITASRESIGDLTRSMEIRNSPFFNSFSSHRIVTGPLDHEDLMDIGAEYGMDNSAISALSRLTNGAPFVVHEVLEAVQQAAANDIISEDVLQRAFPHAYERCRERIQRQADDLDEGARDLLRTAIHENKVSLKSIPRDFRSSLTLSGFLKERGDYLLDASIFIKKWCEEVNLEYSALEKSFGSLEQYNLNILKVLKRRLELVREPDGDLKRLVGRCFSDIPDHGELLLTNIQHVVMCAFVHIWRLEGCERVASSQFEILTSWSNRFRVAELRREEQERVERWKLNFPTEGADQLHLLDLVTGRDSIQPLTKYVTKNTHVLLKNLWTFRNFGNHKPTRDPIHIGIPYTALFLMIELVESLSLDAKRASSS